MKHPIRKLIGLAAVTVAAVSVGAGVASAHSNVLTCVGINAQHHAIWTVTNDFNLPEFFSSNHFVSGAIAPLGSVSLSDVIPADGQLTVTGHWSDGYSQSDSAYDQRCVYVPPTTTTAPTTTVAQTTTTVADHKVWICHVPPGNPANFQAIEVDANGWDGHDQHHDDLGPFGSEQEAIEACTPQQTTTTTIAETTTTTTTVGQTTTSTTAEPTTTVAQTTTTEPGTTTTLPATTTTGPVTTTTSPATTTTVPRVTTTTAPSATTTAPSTTASSSTSSTSVVPSTTALPTTTVPGPTTTVPTGPPPSLPKTGSPDVAIAGFGALVLSAGVALFAAARRPR